MSWRDTTLGIQSPPENMEPKDLKTMLFGGDWTFQSLSENMIGCPGKQSLSLFGMFAIFTRNHKLPGLMTSWILWLQKASSDNVMFKEGCLKNCSVLQCFTHTLLETHIAQFVGFSFVFYISVAYILVVITWLLINFSFRIKRFIIPVSIRSCPGTLLLRMDRLWICRNQRSTWIFVHP